MRRIEKLENLLVLKEAIRGFVEKDGRKVSEERLEEFMKDLGGSYLK